MRIRHYAVVIALAFIAFHLPFLPKSLEDLDSINFALGLRDFDVARHQPHPPGYPVYIAAGKLVHALVASEVKGLALISMVSGSLGVLALIALFSRLESAWPRKWAVGGALVAVTCPLYWFTAARPLSDMPGLAAAVAVQALIVAAAGSGRIIAASALAGAAIGIRSQVAWLTVPLLMWIVLRHRAPHRGRFIAAPVAAFVAGTAVWAVPLVAVTGGPLAYWRTLFAQGAEDLTGIEMLWTTPTPRTFLRAMYYAFVAPWGMWQLALGVMIFAAGGVLEMYRTARSSLLLLTIAFGPYLIFDILFLETFTSRYALPLVVPVAYLATRTLATFPPPGGMPLAIGVVFFGLFIGGGSTFAYALMEAPAFRLLGDMRTTAERMRAVKSPVVPVLAMHRREDLDMRRPIDWTGGAMPPFSRRLAAPSKHEWLELVKYWNAGGREPVWFVADPDRTDLALIDHASGLRGGATRETTTFLGLYRWPLIHRVLLGGVRPGEMDWHVFDSPGWYLGEGWSLTPETAGVATEDRRGSGVKPIEGWIRRRSEAVTLMVGGRNLIGDMPATVSLAIDDRPIEEISAPPGFFLKLIRLPEGGLAGEGDYARLSVTADQSRVAIEQFDAQSAGRVVLGFGEGWHELEFNPATSRSWRWMSERGVLRVRAEGHALELAIAGETEGFTRGAALTIRVGDRVIGQWTVGSQFAIQTTIPVEAAGDETAIVIESDQFFVPAERSRRTQDLRHLALKVAGVLVRPVS